MPPPFPRRDNRATPWVSVGQASRGTTAMAKPCLTMLAVAA
jgi:hypothetical protein